MRKGIIIFLLITSFFLSAQTNPPDFELNNGMVHVKADLSRGGAISYISKSGMDRNVVNISDEGRYIQQSYYAGSAINRKKDGQNPAWSPWPWNPVQAGDSYHNRAQVLAYSHSGDTLYVKCIPMLWDMNNRPAEAMMEQWITLTQNVLHVRNKLSCRRTDSIYGEGISDDQELPATYIISAMNNLYSYFGDRPFTGEPLAHPCPVNLSSGFWGRYENNMVTENWMAFTDDDLWGIGVYNPGCNNFLAGISGTAGQEATGPSTGYIAPVTKEALFKNSVYEYDYYLLAGSLNQIRAEIYQIHSGDSLRVPVEEAALTDIWPNPAAETVNIRSACLCNNPVTLTLFNMQGERVFTNTLPLNTVYQLDVSSFSKGVYVIGLADSKSAMKRKLVIE